MALSTPLHGKQFCGVYVWFSPGIRVAPGTPVLGPPPEPVIFCHFRFTAVTLGSSSANTPVQSSQRDNPKPIPWTQTVLCQLWEKMHGERNQTTLLFQEWLRLREQIQGVASGWGGRNSKADPGTRGDSTSFREYVAISDGSETQTPVSGSLRSRPKNSNWPKLETRRHSRRLKRAFSRVLWRIQKATITQTPGLGCARSEPQNGETSGLKNTNPVTSFWTGSAFTERSVQSLTKLAFQIKIKGVGFLRKNKSS